MDSLEIVPPPRSTRELTAQTGSQSLAFEKYKKPKPPPTEEETEATLVPMEVLPAPLVEPWAISNVFGEGSQMVEPGSQPTSGVDKPPSPPDTTVEELSTQPAPSNKLLKGAEMPKVDKTGQKAIKLARRRQRFLKLTVFASGALVGYILVNMLDNQKKMIEAMHELTTTTATLENVVAAYVIK